MRVYKTGKDVFIISNGKPSEADCFAKIDSAGQKYADLFAAAPELLEACKLMIQWLTDSKLVAVPGDGTEYSIVTDIKQAIAKAEGN